MSDDAQTPGARRNPEPAGDAEGGTPPGNPHARGVWPAPADGGAGDAVPQAGPPVVEPDAPATADVPDPWAPPVHGTPAFGRGAVGPGAGGPGETLAAGGPLPWSSPSTPSSPSVHDQQTVVSFPAMGTPAPPAAHGSPANPFAPPAAGEPVPPPPIAPDGPGRVPYGYPGGYGHPTAQPPGYGAAPGQAYHGWTGTAPMPSNGLGVTGLVLGIISATVFCLWPVAILLGVLGVIFGAVGRSKATRGEATNPGQALAGIICGAAGIVLGIGFGVLVLTTSL
ncbi:DUF4190 domain-containing protein [Streptomyces sp. Tu 3180]|uniref:DUF4190 domain-containing protein n=1 Tax=Streptomyces sp. Tu 3180 TaxID=2682611 RepID=UPI001FB65640|nr:DUF4190 domain-containing protein [Streptomyces sp. Tu 3180]